MIWNYLILHTSTVNWSWLSEAEGLIVIPWTRSIADESLCHGSVVVSFNIVDGSLQGVVIRFA